MNITGAVAGNPKFHHIKTVLCKTVSNTPVKYSILTICCCSVAVCGSLNHSRQDKGSFSKDNIYKQQHYHAILKACSYLFIHITLRT